MPRRLPNDLRAAVTRFSAPIRVGLLTPYFAFFEERFPADFRMTQEAYTVRLADSLRELGFEVVESGLVDGAESAATARRRFADAGIDVVVVAATMAAPPTYGGDALEGIEAPVIVWDERRTAGFATDVDEVEATRASSILGSIMLANVLGRGGRRYLTVSSEPDDPSPIGAAIRGAAAASSLRGARLGLLGGIIPGYGDVLLDTDTAAALGVELVEVGPDSVEAAVAASEGADAPLPAPFEISDAGREHLSRSLRVHRFLEAIVADAGLDSVALNCHSDVLRFSDELGVVSCLASSLLWTSGVPVACTGDAATAVALMLGARIAGSAQYCEGYAVESGTGEMVVSSCGMADVSLCASGEAARVEPNELYPGNHGLGLATRYTFDAGPATIVGFGPATPTLPARLVASAGRLTGRGFTHLNGPSGTVEFDRPGSGAASQAWIDAGPAHHLALMRGARLPELEAAAAYMAVQLIAIGPDGVG
jgi:L-fucose isomerase-like protein